MSADVAELTKRYRISVAAAGDVLCPCGKNTGQDMRSLGHKEVHWFATRTTRPENTSEFRMAVKAARIIKAARKAATDANKASVNTAGNHNDDDAKHAQATCRDCGRIYRMSRNAYDRRGTRCLECGGKLDTLTSPVGVYLTLREAAETFGCSTATLTTAIRVGDLPATKVRGRWQIGLAACERYLATRKEAEWFRERGVQVSRGTICPHCKKVFRNWAAMKLHIRDNHEEF